jgi:POT family proton-dependent oligopeptide transporter
MSQHISTAATGDGKPKAHFGATLDEQQSIAMPAKGHPPGLYLLFVVEMWERFSYYGMRALLILYLVQAAGADNPGRGWDRGSASRLYGWYTGLAYLFPLLGGMLADRFLGTHRSMVVGGVLIALGHIVLWITGLGDLAHNDMGMSVFVGGLVLIVIGTGYFKPCVSVMVGQLYGPNDPRRDGAFTIFYIGINVGAALCAFVCGTLGEKVGWHWGFGSAAVGMVAGLVVYFLGRPFYLKAIGLPPPGRSNTGPQFFVGSLVAAVLITALYHVGSFGYIGGLVGNLFAEGIVGMVLQVVLAGGILALVIWFVSIQEPGERGPTASIFIFMLFNAFFWIAFEQAGSSLNIFADQNTDRHIFGWEMPATWFQSVNPCIIVLLGPVFAAMWTALGKRHRDPTQPVKIGLGLLLLGIGYLFMVAAGVLSKDGAKVGMLWLTMTYIFHTLGELCLSPTGLSYVTKAAPVRFVSLLMGIWFISSFLANLGGGYIAATVEEIERGNIVLPWHFGGQADFFFLFVVTSFGAGLLILVLTPLFKMLLPPSELGLPVVAPDYSTGKATDGFKEHVQSGTSTKR